MVTKRRRSRTFGRRELSQPPREVDAGRWSCERKEEKGEKGGVTRSDRGEARRHWQLSCAATRVPAHHHPTLHSHSPPSRNSPHASLVKRWASHQHRKKRTLEIPGAGQRRSPARSIGRVSRVGDGCFINDAMRSTRPLSLLIPDGRSLPPHCPAYGQCMSPFTEGPR